MALSQRSDRGSRETRERRRTDAWAVPAMANATSTPAPDRVDRIAGAIFGTAVGDSLGLPREGMSRRRAARVYGGAPMRHRLFFRRGMTSDDTEHTCLLGQALLRDGEDPSRFARALAWKPRLWLLGLPAGIGQSTLFTIVRLWFGFSPKRSGVFSAGNGPAMRAVLLGVC